MLTTPAQEHPTRPRCKHCDAAWTRPDSAYGYCRIHEIDCKLSREYGDGQPLIESDIPLARF